MTASQPFLNGPPTPEELQRQLADFMRQHFASAGKAQASADFSKAPPSSSPPEEAPVFHFDKKPRDVKRHLDRFVIRQDDAKKVLSVAICDHYHQVRLALEGKAAGSYAKQNIILIGPTGVGKTYLIRSIAELIGVPFVKGDATKFSETGYVGGDVEDLVRELVRKADGDVERAECGIIFIDEIDKIAGSGGHGGRDVSGRGVQTNLLKLMEETEVPARSPQDIAGQIQSMMDMQRGRKKSATSINTKHILFIVSGAFDGLEKIVSRRLGQKVIGFNSAPGPNNRGLAEVTTRDFIEFGFEPEFIGRLPVRVQCHGLDAGDLCEILKTSEGSILRQYKQTFGAYGIDLEVEDGALQEIAALAHEEQTGARGLMTVCERVFREFKYELPSTSIRQVHVTGELVRSPKPFLEALLAQDREAQAGHQGREAAAYGEDFSRDFGWSIRFTDEAVERLQKLAEERSQSVRELCGQLFKDYQFGLKLIFQNTGRREFVIGLENVNEPDKVLSEWVVASYRKEQLNPAPAPPA